MSAIKSDSFSDLPKATGSELDAVGRLFRSMSARKLLSRPWTDEEDARLVEMIERGRQRAAIAAALKRTQAAISGRLWVLRDRERQHRPED